MSQESVLLFSQEDDLSSNPESDGEEEEVNEDYFHGQQRPRFESFKQNKQANSALAFTSSVPDYESGLSSTRAEKMPFSACCRLIDALSGERNARTRTGMLASFLASHGLSETNQLVFPFLRLLLPEYDNGRPRYYIKESTLTRIYKFALGLNGDLLTRLERFNDPSLNDICLYTNAKGKEICIKNGRFHSVLRSVLAVQLETKISEPQKHASLSCQEINQFLDRIHDANSVAEKAKVINEMVMNHHFVLPSMHEILSKILLRSFSEIDANSTLLAYHTNAPRGYHVLGNLRKVLALCGRSLSNIAFRYDLFAPGRPMLASRTRIDLATARLGDFIVEEKLDGDRMIVHLDREFRNYRLFSRNQKDFTYVYGAPQLVSDLFEAFECQQCIIDGELVPYSASTGDVLRVGKCINLNVAQEMFKANSADRDPTQFLCFFAFDILYIKTQKDHPGQDLTSLPLWERKSILARIFSSKARKYVRIVRPMQIVRDCSNLDVRHKKVMEQLDLIIQAGREGLVLKSLDASYSLAGRSPLWVKVKPDYVGNLSEGLDCIVLGGEYFEEATDRMFQGKKQVSKLLFGLRYNSPNTGTIKYRPFCLTGVGLTKLDFRYIHRVFEQKGILSTEGRPQHFRWTGCSVWLRPEDSFIVEVTGTQMFKRFRFPYIRGIRFDKDWSECASVEECDHRFRQGYLFSQVRAVDVKRSDFHGKPRANRIVSACSIAEESPNMQLSCIFSGSEFLVFPGEYPFENLSSKSAVEQLIRQHGGRVRDFKDGFTGVDYYIASDVAQLRVKNAIRFQKDCPAFHSVRFLLDSIRMGKLAIPFSYDHYVFVPASEKRSKQTDEFDDSFSTFATLETLSRSLHLCRSSSFELESMESEEQEALELASLRYFTGLHVYFVDGEQERLTQIIVSMHGGKVVSEFDLSKVTHVVRSSNRRSNAIDDKCAQDNKMEGSNSPAFVSCQWIWTTLRECQLQQKLWRYLTTNRT